MTIYDNYYNYSEKWCFLCVRFSIFFLPWGSLHSIYVLLLESWDKQIITSLSIYSKCKNLHDLNSSLNQFFYSLLLFTFYLISIYSLSLLFYQSYGKVNGLHFYGWKECFYKVYWFLWMIVLGKFLNISSPQYF